MKRQFPLLFALTCSMSMLAQVPTNVPTAGLMAYYPFNGNGNDASGTGNNATNNGATYAEDRFGAPDAAASFNGSTSYMTVATPTFSMSYSGAFTYSVWIKKQVQPAAGIVMMTGNSSTGNFVTLIQGMSVETFGTNMQGSAWTFINCPQTLDTWDNYVATYNAGAMAWYKNGGLYTADFSSYTTATTMNMPLFIGKGVSGGNFLGLIDDIGIWNRVLSSGEIAGLYDLPTNVADMAANERISIAPNPARDHIGLSVDASLVGAHYDLYDATGRGMMSGKVRTTNITLDVSGILPGICFLRITSNDQTFTKAVIIER